MPPPALVDSHVHFFDLQEPSLHYSWLQPDVRELDPIGPVGALQAQRYWAEDFLAESRFSDVQAVIHVDAGSDQPDPVAETRWIQAFHDRLGVPQAHVARCDLARPDAQTIIDRHREYPVLRGVRDLRYDGYLTDAAWERGFSCLADTGLVCCMDPLLEHMSHAATLIEAHPAIPVCIDHASYPRRRDADYFRAWREGMHAIARNPNAVVKISGLGMVDHQWTVESIRPWVLACIGEFGVERSLFGTNWPVDRLYSSYTDVAAAYREIVSEFTVAEQHALLAGNARRIFRLAEKSSVPRSQDQEGAGT
jgi:predicted TIM-barrel fold metal-dependent hydrolase